MAEHESDQGRRPSAALVQCVFIVSLLWTALFLAWQSLSAADFLYPLWYEWLEIREHIAHYGPLNEYKSGFESTRDDVRFALFAAIADAIHSGGEGLRALCYHDRSGACVQLLREPELVHLQSVANLLDSLRAFSYVALALLLLCVGLMRWGTTPLPQPRRVLIGAAVAITAAGLAVLAIGPERVFNTVHTWVFPVGEQWYFYYEESLMSTLMKAPDLFGAIAVALLLAGLLWFAFLLFAIRLLLVRKTVGR